MPFARCSDLDRLLSCPGDAVLRGATEKSEATKVAADWGTMAHYWKETGDVVAVNGRKNLVPLFEKKLRVTGVRREQWWPEGMQHETAIAISPGSLTVGAAFRKADGNREDKEAWKAGFNDRYYTGTMDGWWLMFDRLHLDDLKTGKNVSWDEYQFAMKGYALGLCKILQYRQGVHVTLTHWPRYPVDSRPERFGRVVEQDELAAFEKQLVKLRDDVLRGRETGNVALTPGPQCLWCKSRGVCPRGTEWNDC